MLDTFGEIGAQLMGHTERVHKLWNLTFGDGLLETWKDPGYRKVLEFAQSHLNEIGERSGHMSVFIKHPVSDRLYLEFSTESRLMRKARPGKRYVHPDNWDKDRKKPYYQLFDRLCDDDKKNQEQAISSRGLTGWVAVTGLTLRLNNENDQHRLKYIRHRGVEEEQLCRVYGSPKWGQKVTEVPGEEKEFESKRYMAVPILSCRENSKREIIGVIRYSCSQNSSQELTHYDVPFMQAIARIIASIENLKLVKTKANRMEKLESAKQRLRKSKDFHEFLRFMSENLRSEITSLYLPVEIGDFRGLRIFEASGISKPVGSLRDELRDYAGYADDGLGFGLTWELYQSDVKTPHIVEAAPQEESWAGKNTKFFYRHLIPNEHLCDLMSPAKDSKVYAVKLMGRRIDPEKREYGVLKVEFPSTFDSSNHYNEVDQKFFRTCCEALKEEIVPFIEFLKGGSLDKFSKKEAAMYIAILLKTRFLDAEEAPDLYKTIEKYISRRKGDKEFRDALSNALKAFGKEVLDEIRKNLAKLFVSGIVGIILTLL